MVTLNKHGTRNLKKQLAMGVETVHCRDIEKDNGRIKAAVI